MEVYDYNETTEQLHIKTAQEMARMRALMTTAKMPLPNDENERISFLHGLMKTSLCHFAKSCPNGWARHYSKAALNRFEVVTSNHDLFAMKVAALRVLANSVNWTTADGIRVRSELIYCLRHV